MLVHVLVGDGPEVARGTEDPVADRDRDPALRAVDTRASLLRAGRLLDEVSLDRYTFTRDAYLQRRRAEIFESESPALPDETKDE